MKNFILILFALGFTAMIHSQKVAFLNLTHRHLMSIDDKDTYMIYIDSDSSGIEYYRDWKLIKIVKEKQYYRDYFLNLDKNTFNAFIDSIATKMKSTDDDRYLRMRNRTILHEENVLLPEGYQIYVRYTDKTFDRFLLTWPYYVLGNGCLDPEDVFMNNIYKLFIIGYGSLYKGD